MTDPRTPLQTTGPNRLATAPSPYLRQHAQNPVDWHPWGEAALALARERDVPLFVSVGYSTCHWCHVMAHESFEDAEVAQALNEGFVCVKVDREERPDIDALYMNACQMLTGTGGWPLTIFALPDGTPFFAATYLPKRSRGGRAGLLDLIPRVRDIYATRRADVEASAADIAKAMRERAAELLQSPPDGRTPAAGTLRAAFNDLVANFDTAHGGFGGAPKFPSPHLLLFLLRHGRRTGDSRSQDMALATLRGMLRGGLWDRLGGGIHRYSTDARWLLPHFEKMLHDQAMFMLATAETWLATREDDMREAALATADYILRDMALSGGGLAAAEDADSLTPEGKRREGAFYTFTFDEVREAAGDNADLAVRLFGITGEGNIADESTGRREGHNVLHLPLGDDAATTLGIDADELAFRHDDILAGLRSLRATRRRPHRDDKLLTDWNGLAIAALARCGHVFDAPHLTDAAASLADAVLTLQHTPDGGLLHSRFEGTGSTPGFLDDYAFVIWGLLELYTATNQPQWLEEAIRLQHAQDDRFLDPVDGGYWHTPADAPRTAALRLKEARDGALPSGNAAALLNLLRLARLLGDASYEEKAHGLIRAFASQVRHNPLGAAMFLCGVDFALTGGRLVIIAGEAQAPDTEAMLDAVRRSYSPNTVMHLRDGNTAERLAMLAPFTSHLAPIDGKTTAWLCQDNACSAPIQDPAALAERLAGARPL